MVSCGQCDTLILFGGIQDGGRTFCKPLCHNRFVYQATLARLRESPSDPHLKQRTLDAGRALAATTRKGSGVAIFDEVALMNDIQAACAGAQQGAPPPSQSPTLSIEQRMRRLDDLLSASVISEQEYQAKRKELLAQL